MSFREERYVRFQDWRSEYSVSSEKIVSEGRHNAFDLLKDKTLGAWSFFGRTWAACIKGYSVSSEKISHSDNLNRSTPEERRTWAASFIQAAWHRYCRKKLEDALFEKEKRLQAAIAKLSFGAALYASRFAANMMRILRRNATRKARLQERVPVRLLQKPAEPNFFAEGE